MSSKDEKKTNRNKMEQTRAERKSKKRKLQDAILGLPSEFDDTERNETLKRRKQGQFTKNQPGLTNSKSTEKVFIKGKNVASTGHSMATEGQKMPNTGTLKVVDDGYGMGPVHSLAITDTNPSPEQSKKARKAERKAKELKPATNRPLASLQVESAAVIPKQAFPTQNSKKGNQGMETTSLKSEIGEAIEKKAAKSHRFIVFVGNLPFSATTKSIQKHLAPVRPQSVRHLTSKDNLGKSRGCAFVEFDGYDDMKACLKTFHHSIFNDGISEGRKINVELTAGGGGNKANRQAKIGHKNQKLKEERIRRIQAKVQTKLTKRYVVTDHNSVHPSRRALVPESRQ